MHKVEGNIIQIKDITEVDKRVRKKRQVRHLTKLKAHGCNRKKKGKFKIKIQS